MNVPVIQYQALIPMETEFHLYAGSTLYDLEKHEFRKISTVVKTSRKAGYTTAITFVGGAKRVLSSAKQLQEFADGHKWVSLRDMPEPLNTIHYSMEAYPGSWNYVTGDTGFTELGRKMIEEIVKKQVVEALQKNQKTQNSVKADNLAAINAMTPLKPDPPRRRWFR